MNVSMQMPSTPQHDLVAVTAALRGALLQRVEQGIRDSGLDNYLLYLLAKRLVFAGPQATAALASQLRQDPHAVDRNLDVMAQRGMARYADGAWMITTAGREALVAANDSGGQVLEDLRTTIGVDACDRLVAGMRDALAALRRTG